MNNIGQEPAYNLVRLATAHAQTDSSKDAAATPTLGVGMSSLFGVVKEEAVQYASTVPTHRSHENCFIEIITNEHDLAEKLSLKVSASFKSLSFRASASLEYLRSRTFHSYALSMIAIVDVAVNSEKVVKPLVREEVLRRIPDIDRVYEIYGDSYVSEVIYGGRLLLVLDFTTSTESEYEALKLALSAKAGTYEGSLALATSLDEVFKYSNLSFRMFSEGLPNPEEIPIPSGDTGATAQLDDAAKTAALDFVTAFPTLIPVDSKVIMSYVAKPIAGCSNWTGESLSLVSAVRAVEDLATLRRSGTTLKGDLEYVVAHETQFVDHDVATIKSAIVELNAWLVQIDRAAEDFLIKPWAKHPQIKDLIPAYQQLLPARREFVRPKIIAEYREEKIAGTHAATSNLDDDMNGGWIGRKPGSWSPLTNIRLICDPPLIDARLVYRAIPNSGKEGVASEGEWALSPDGYIHQFGIRLEGLGAKNYTLRFWLHMHDTGDEGPHAGDFSLRGFPDGRRGVQSIRLELKPI